MQFIFYSPTSGIWQTVWIEPVEKEAVESVKVVPDIDKGVVGIKVNTTSGQKDDLKITIKDGENVVVKKSVTANIEGVIELGSDFKLWSPQAPFLYDMEITLAGGDKVKSYFGMRKIEMRKVDKFQRIEFQERVLLGKTLLT